MRDRYIRTIRRAFFILFAVSCLFSCGELDTVLPSAGTYRVDALVNEVSLNDCSLIGREDKIYPYFVSPLNDDPDVTGLMVVVEDSSGHVMGRKIHYTLGGDPAETEVFPGDSGEAVEETGDAGESGESDAPELGQVRAAESINIIEPAEIDELTVQIPVTRLDKNLPFFTLPDSLEIGQYTMSFQVLGKKEVLYREEKTIYYLEDAEFSLGDIQKYLPGLSAGSHLIPPGLTIMLEAQVLSDERLDPYIIWYSGRKRLSEGRFAGGSGFMLWKAPEQTGFHTIRAEIFPVRPVAGLAGRSREITLPISSKVKSAGYFSPPPENIMHWYLFQGNLQDSKTPVSTERALIPREEKNSRWLPEDNIYGLAAGPKASYLLPLFSFAGPEETHKSGRFMLRFKPVSEGVIFSALFKAESSPRDQVCVNLSFFGEALTLDIMGREESASIPLRYVPEEENGFISLFVDFSIREDRFDARLSREHDENLPPEPASVSLPNPLSGEGSFQLGASLAEPEIPETEEEADSVPPEDQALSPLVVIFDEAALSRLEEPVLPDEPEPEPLVLFPEEGEEISPEESLPAEKAEDESEARPELAVGAETETEPELEPETEAGAETETGPELEPEAEARAESDAGPDAEPLVSFPEEGEEISPEESLSVEAPEPELLLEDASPALEEAAAESVFPEDEPMPEFSSREESASAPPEEEAPEPRDVS
jgi:hypothetical protein